MPRIVKASGYVERLNRVVIALRTAPRGIRSDLKQEAADFVVEQGADDRQAGKRTSRLNGGTMSLNTFLVALAFLLLVLAWLKVPEPPHCSFGWGGMALWMFTIVLGGVRL
jgi:hypothetical protein